MRAALTPALLAASTEIQEVPLSEQSAMAERQDSGSHQSRHFLNLRGGLELSLPTGRFLGIFQADRPLLG